MHLYVGMRNILLSSSLLLGLLTVGTSSAQAMGVSRLADSPHFGSAPCPTAEPAEVPELDPKAGGAALALLLGGVAVMTGRRRDNV